jgi:hypothetical protein
MEEAHMARVEDDPDWLLARAVYLYPDADTPGERLSIRFEAAWEIREIERRYRAAVAAK